jgi:hypothetical protein
MTALTLVVDAKDATEAIIHFEGAVNPSDKTSGQRTPAEKLYPLTFTQETRAELRLVQNPADRFPRAVRQKLDAAQETVWGNNKPTGKIGDKSTQFSAIAETVAKRSLTRTGGREAMHIGKNESYGVALARYLADDDYPEHAKSIFRAEKKKSDEAKAWCAQYDKGETPSLPAWAASYMDELVKLGLPAEYPVEEHFEGRRGRRRR